MTYRGSASLAYSILRELLESFPMLILILDQDLAATLLAEILAKLRKNHGLCFLEPEKQVSLNEKNYT